MKYVIDLHATARGLFFFLFLCKFHPWRVYSRSVKLHNQRETDLYSGIQSLAGLQRRKHWSATSKTLNLFRVLSGRETVPESNFHLVLKRYSTLKAAHLITLYWPKRSSSLMKAELWCCHCMASIIQSCELAAFVSLYSKWEKHLLSNLTHDETFWYLTLQGPLSPVFATVCVCVCVCVFVWMSVWVPVFALCSLLWECRSRWGLLTELELSFHTGGNSFFLICWCLFLTLCLPHSSSQTSSSLLPPSLSSLSSSLCCFIHAVM